MVSGVGASGQMQPRTLTSGRGVAGEVDDQNRLMNRARNPRALERLERNAPEADLASYGRLTSIE